MGGEEPPVRSCLVILSRRSAAKDLAMRPDSGTTEKKDVTEQALIELCHRQ
jgi:hypothetical protein